MAIINSEQWEEALQEVSDDGQSTPFRDLIREMPGILGSADS